MINFNDVTKENIKKNNPNWLWIWKNKFIINLIINQPDIDKIYLYAKDPHDAKYQFLINKWESTGLKHFSDSKAFIEYSNDMDDIYKKHQRTQYNKNCKILFLMIWLLICIVIKNLIQ